MNELEQYKFFAIVGVGRSGTSLLMSMLNAHPLISLPPETHFIDRYVIDRPWKKTYDLVNTFETDHRFRRLNLDKQDINELAFRIGANLKPANIYKEILRLYAEKKGVKIIGDKAPKNIEYLPVLRQLYPEGWLIHIIRDPRDVYLSRTKAAWSSSRSDLSHLIAYRSQYRLGQRFGKKLFGSKYHEIKYENLLSHPELELSKICELLSVPFDEAMLEYSKSSHELVSPEEMAWKKETLEPIIADNMNKWRDGLTGDKVALIETVCSRPFRDGLYKTTQEVNILKIFALNLYFGAVSTLYQCWVVFKNWSALITLPRE